MTKLDALFLFRLFGNTGLCSACNKTIPAFEMVMRVRGDRVYHRELINDTQVELRLWTNILTHNILILIDWSQWNAFNAVSAIIGKCCLHECMCLVFYSPPPFLAVCTDSALAIGFTCTKIVYCASTIMKSWQFSTTTTTITIHRMFIHLAIILKS